MPATIHDKIITAMTKVLKPFKGELRLLARLSDPAINNKSEKEAYLFVPDLHLISTERQKSFGAYSFNHTEGKILLLLLQAMASLKESLARKEGCKLITVQLGDYFDMWRENPGLSPISDDAHGELRDIFYRGVDREMACLKATVILGNHDTDCGRPLPEINFLYKAFNRTVDQRPFLFATHGDAFDMLEILLPESVKEFGVQFIGKLTPVNTYQLADWGKMAAKLNKPLKDLAQAITEPHHALELGGGAPLVSPGKTLPDRLCRIVDSADQAGNEFFEKTYKAVDVAKESGLPGQHVKVVAMGHTHKAAMIFCNPSDSGRKMMLMDIGAWIENCSYPLEESGMVVSEPSAQLGVIHGNDARIYQVRVAGNVISSGNI